MYFCLQVRTLREELLAARRERAVGEAREAELRREIAAIKRQVLTYADNTSLQWWCFDGCT